MASINVNACFDNGLILSRYSTTFFIMETSPLSQMLPIPAFQADRRLSAYERPFWPEYIQSRGRQKGARNGRSSPAIARAS
jgi:hypothetical protein